MDHLRDPLFSTEVQKTMTFNLHLINATMTSTELLDSILNVWTINSKNWNLQWLVTALPHDTYCTLAHMTEKSETQKRDRTSTLMDTEPVLLLALVFIPTPVPLGTKQHTPFEPWRNPKEPSGLYFSRSNYFHKSAQIHVPSINNRTGPFISSLHGFQSEVLCRAE